MARSRVCDTPPSYGQKDPERRRPAPQVRVVGRGERSSHRCLLQDEGAPPFAFKSGHWVDVAKAIEMHPHAKKLLAEEAATPGLRRTMVTTAVIMRFPVAN
ncbi:hypothetical protein [Methylobacterium sp. C1]|uniref:hypothetical protein n=1 Tax=Methylobacterium sp. C1 TaxID=1479019 RepID=UPI001FD9DBCF|nr:hypothetical protein [Methylobacterium sp. C1]